MSGTLSARSLAALAAGITLGNIGGNLMPVLLDGFRDRYGLSSGQAGVVAAAQLVATAVVSLALSSRAARPGRARLARAGLVVAAVGFLAAWLSPGAVPLTIANLIAGVGLGAVFAAASAGLSSTPDVDRATTLTVLCSTVAIAALILLIPLTDHLWGATTGFAVVAAGCLVGLPLVGRLPDAPIAHASHPGPRVSWLFVAAVVLFGVTEQGLWSYAAVLGGDAGIGGPVAALILGIAAVAALAGVPLAAALRRLWGSAVALGVVMGVGALAKFLVASPPGPVLFGIATSVWQICYLAVLVLVLATAAKADPTGRWAAAAAGALALGTGIGPAVIGVTLEHLGSVGLGVGTLVAVVCSAVPVLRVAVSTQREDGDPTADRTA